MTSRRRLLLIGGLLAIAAAGFTAWTFSASKRPVYQTVVAEQGDIVTRITASGSLQAVGTVEVGSEVSGLIKELYADFNTPVKKGQVLARIDPSTFEARVLQGEAQEATALAQLEQARADLKEAERDYETKRKLSTSGWYSARGTETAEATLAKARAAVKLAEANLLQARANLNQARIDLSRTYIRAPVDGIVISRAINVGQTVAASFQTPTLFTIAEDLSEMQVEAKVDEADIGAVSPGQRAEFTVDAYPDQVFHGEVKEVRLASGDTGQTQATSTGVVTYTVIITAPNKDGKLLPNMTANATIYLGEVKNVLKLPIMALSYEPAAIAAEAARRAPPPAGGFGPPMGPPRGGNRTAPPPEAAEPADQPPPGVKGQPGTVWVLARDGKPERRPVFTGVRTDEEVAVVGGKLQPGEKVIISESAAS
ncbi:efflux RND transporter periplasmic adaptor subunit [Pedomonas sp. V897]|uniref:efflux RND transporter periplasmic adaptor subunit n=1 Tax=Pedomonas sp. V897 TaxID=3446482 RepID=UPI003EE245C3